MNQKSEQERQNSLRIGAQMRNVAIIVPAASYTLLDHSVSRLLKKKKT